MSGSDFAEAIVVAAGASSRMAGRDKVFAPLAGRPIAAWSLEAIAAARSVRRVVLVAAADRLDAFHAAPWLPKGTQVVAGGARRQASVAAGLAAAGGEVILVHDAARPLVSPALVDRVASAARAHGAAIPVRPIHEAVKRVAGERVAGSVDRAGLTVAQTPQAARRELLLQAFAANPPDGAAEFADEAALLGAIGVPVATVEGEAANLKVTVPADLDLAEALLAVRSGPVRPASARDVHPFGPLDGLALGGILVPEAPRLHGHSDGDVVLHAIADALLGGAGLGDLGRRFPATDPATAGVASRRLLEVVVAEAAAAGWRVERVEVRIDAGRPRLGGRRLEAMRSAIADLLGLAPEAVDVRASSGNLTGPTGAGLAIAAEAHLGLRGTADR